MEMKLEIDNNDAGECCICGEIKIDLQTPEEFDASYTADNSSKVPLRAMLLQLNNNKVVPDGQLCEECCKRTVEAHNFSLILASRAPPPLSVKIRELRSRLLDLAKKTNVFIVVGGPDNTTKNYNEDNIIMVDPKVLEDAVNKDKASTPSAPLFVGPCGSSESSGGITCWGCGAHFPSQTELEEHKVVHETEPLYCLACNTQFQSQYEMAQHEPSCISCTHCVWRAPDHASLLRHVAHTHAPACTSVAALKIHEAGHKRAAHVCGLSGCILRFDSRSSLLNHIKKVHGESTNETANHENMTCAECNRTFASAAGLKRHARVHRQSPVNELYMDGVKRESIGLLDEEDAEYLEMETLETQSDASTE